MKTTTQSKTRTAGSLHRLGMLMTCCLLLVGCGPKEEETKIWEVKKVTEGHGQNAHYFTHRDVHTLLESDSRRMIVPGDLGTPGDKIKLRNIPGGSLYY